MQRQVHDDSTIQAYQSVTNLLLVDMGHAPM